MSFPGTMNFDEVHGWSTLRGYKTFSHPIPGDDKQSARDVLWSMGLELTSQSTPSNTRIKGLRFNAYLIARVHTTALAVSWSRMRLPARRRFLYIFVGKGTVEVKGDAKTISAPEGGLGIIFPGSSEAVINIRSDAELVFFSFDMNEIRPLEIKSSSPSNLRAESPVFRAAYAYLCGVAHSPENAEIGSTQVLRELTREVARAISLEVLSGVQSLDTLTHAQQIIERRFRSVSFTIEDLALEIGLSRRSLERACADQGLSLADELRTRRTHHAFHLLPEQPYLPLQEIATQSGFGSTEVMRRAFLRYYGDSPAAIRKVSASAKEADNSAAQTAGQSR